MTMSLSRKVLIESSLDTSILSVIGNYDDHNFTGGSAASFTQQGSSDQSSSALHSSNLFSTLLHLMEPYHVILCVCVYVCVYIWQPPVIIVVGH